MTFAEVRDATVRLVNQYTIAGTDVPPTYNNQQDYLNRIPDLINDAQMDMATTVRKIPEVAQLRELERTKRQGVIEYKMPDDAWKRRGSGLLVPTRHGTYERFNYVRMAGNNILLPKELPPETLVEYFRYPKRLSQTPEENEELDNTPEVHSIIPFYAAAHIKMEDDAFVYATLYNEYQARKAAMEDPIYTEPGTVQDIYCLSDTYLWG